MQADLVQFPDSRRSPSANMILKCATAAAHFPCSSLSLYLMQFSSKNDLAVKYALYSIDQPVGGERVSLGRQVARGLLGCVVLVGGLADKAVTAWQTEQKDSCAIPTIVGISSTLTGRTY